MNILLFGNEDVEYDKSALELEDKLKKDFPGHAVLRVNPNEDIPVGNKSDIVIIDVIEGIDNVSLFDEADIDKFHQLKRTSVHDYDLSFQLKYLKKLGKIKRAAIIGIPIDKKADYLRIQSILRKLVAQDMQGS